MFLNKLYKGIPLKIWLAWLTVIVLFVCSCLLHDSKAFVYLLSPFGKGGGYDFFYYYASVKALGENIGNIYDASLMKEYSSALSGGQWAVSDNHPLPFYLFYVPFKLLDFFSAFILHNVLQYAAFCISVFLLCREYINCNAFVRNASAALLALGFLSCGTILDNLWLSQVGGAFCLCLTLVLVCENRGISWLCGLALSIAVLLKLYPALLIIWLLKNRSLKSVCFTCGFLALFSLISGFIWGFGRFEDYFSYMSSGQAYPDFISNHSLMNLIASRLYDMPAYSIKIINLLLIAAFIGYSFWKVRADRSDKKCMSEAVRALDFSVWILVSLILSPISWSHHHTAALIPFIVSLGILSAADPSSRSFKAASVSICLGCILFLFDGESFYSNSVRVFIMQLFRYKAVLLLLCAWTALLWHFSELCRSQESEVSDGKSK